MIKDSQSIIKSGVDIIDERYKSNYVFTGITSGFEKLDNITLGFQKSELIILASRPYFGQTALALSMMRHILLEKKIPCGYFSLQDTAEMTGVRLIAQEARMRPRKVFTGMLKQEDAQKLQDAADKLYKAPFYVVDTSNIHISELQTMARLMVETYHTEIIFIDTMENIEASNTDASFYDQMSEISKALKNLAKDLKIPIVVLCKIPRYKKYDYPELNDLHRMGTSEQNADVIMFLYMDRPSTNDPIQEATIYVEKQRRGPPGICSIGFDTDFWLFENYDFN